MLKREIKYTNFDNVEITEIFYFNLSKPELLELELSYKDGLTKALTQMLKDGDNEKLLLFFKRLVLQSYGEKSEDGKRFVKNEKLSEEFSQTEAYNVLFMEILSDDTAASNFLNGIVPADMAQEMKRIELEQKTAEKVGTAEVVELPKE